MRVVLPRFAKLREVLGEIGDELHAAAESVSRDGYVPGCTVAFAVQQWSLIRHAKCSAFIARTKFCERTWLPVFGKAGFSCVKQSSVKSYFTPNSGDRHYGWCGGRR